VLVSLLATSLDLASVIAHAVIVNTGKRILSCGTRRGDPREYEPAQQTCSLAEAGAPHLWDRKSQKWHAAALICGKALADPVCDAAVRYVAARALAACVAAPWSHAAVAAAESVGGSSPAAVSAALQQMQQAAMDRYVIGPLFKAISAEEWCTHLPLPLMLK
jgi:hypothetical protein